VNKEFSTLVRKYKTLHIAKLYNSREPWRPMPRLGGDKKAIMLVELISKVIVKLLVTKEF